MSFQPGRGRKYFAGLDSIYDIELRRMTFYLIPRPTYHSMNSRMGEIGRLRGQLCSRASNIKSYEYFVRKSRPSFADDGW
jgi:hypothetical protein